MRASPSRGPGAANRLWLFVIGLVLLLLGVAGALIATGWANPLLQRAGAPVQVPGRTEQVAIGQLEANGVALLIGVAGLLVAVLALFWLLAQVPRREVSRPFRIASDGGTTEIAPAVLAEAVTGDLAALPGVVRAEAQLRGTLRNPDLLIDLTVHEQADVQGVLATMQHDIVGDLITTVEGHIASVKVHLDATSAMRSDKQIVIDQRAE